MSRSFEGRSEADPEANPEIPFREMPPNEPTPPAGEKESESLERLRHEILEGKTKAARLPKNLKTGFPEVSPEDRQTVKETVSSVEEEIKHNYQPGFGLVPSARGEGPYGSNVYARDFAQSAGNSRLVEENPQALVDSFETIFKYQDSKGMLPLRVDRDEYQPLQFIQSKSLRAIGKGLFNVIEHGIYGRDERPVYEGSLFPDAGFSGAEDTVPATLIACGEFFVKSEAGRKFVEGHYGQMEKAADYFRTKTDPKDGLAVITKKNPDWADSLVRKGKLGGINVWWARSLRMMEFMSRQLGQEEKADEYREEFRKVKESLMEKLYDSEEGFFRAEEGTDRVDTVASIFGALYLLSPEDAVKVEETLQKRVTCQSGLVNFDPPYPPEQINSIHRGIARRAKKKGWKGLAYDDYHNRISWPWVTLGNIQVKIKIALQHKDEGVRKQYQQEAVDDLVRMSKIFKEAGGYPEILNPDDPISSELYAPPEDPNAWSHYAPPMSKNLMGTMAAYQGAHAQLEELGWI